MKSYRPKVTADGEGNPKALDDFLADRDCLNYIRRQDRLTKHYRKTLGVSREVAFRMAHSTIVREDVPKWAKAFKGADQLIRDRFTYVIAEGLQLMQYEREHGSIMAKMAGVDPEAWKREHLGEFISDGSPPPIGEYRFQPDPKGWDRPAVNEIDGDHYSFPVDPFL